MFKYIKSSLARPKYLSRIVADIFQKTVRMVVCWQSTGVYINPSVISNRKLNIFAKRFHLERYCLNFKYDALTQYTTMCISQNTLIVCGISKTQTFVQMSVTTFLHSHDEINTPWIDCLVQRLTEYIIRKEWTVVLPTVLQSNLRQLNSDPARQIPRQKNGEWYSTEINPTAVSITYKYLSH